MLHIEEERGSVKVGWQVEDKGGWSGGERSGESGGAVGVEGIEKCRYSRSLGGWTWMEAEGWDWYGEGMWG